MAWQADWLDEGLRHLRFGVRALMLINGLILGLFSVYFVARLCWRLVMFLEHHVW